MSSSYTQRDGENIDRVKNSGIRSIRGEIHSPTLSTYTEIDTERESR